MPENCVFSCVPFCLRSIRRFARCASLFKHSERFLEELCNVRSIWWTETIEFIGPWILGKLKTLTYFLLSLDLPRIRDENRKESSSTRRITLVWDINHPISLRSKCFDTILRSHF